MTVLVTRLRPDDHEVAECVNQLVSEGGFPAPRGGAVDISFRFVFSAGT